ncbi:MAG: site-specific integrase, partial [Vagococcus sp.]
MKSDLEDYLHFLKIERGLSENTIKSYHRDLTRYFSFLESRDITQWDKIDR